MSYLLAAEEKTEEALSYVGQAIQKGVTLDQLTKDKDLASLREHKDQWNSLMKKYFPDQFKNK